MKKTGRRVLFIAPKFFGYQDAIKLELENLGYIVDFYDERPATTPLLKALIRFLPKLVAPISDGYFDKIILDTKHNVYDLVFIIKGEAISAQRVKRIKEIHAKARYVYYSWDSLKNFKNGLEKILLFDKVYSFDRFDSETIDIVRHLPLFYLSAYESLGNVRVKKMDIDLLFLGSIHSDRYPVMMRISQNVKKLVADVQIYTHFFYQSRWVFLLRKLFDNNFRSIPWSDIQWLSLDKKDTLSLISRSRIIVDIHHPGQTGLTMRTIECIGAKKKLITTNADVANYDFYNEKNIFIIDRDHPIIDKTFFQDDYMPISDALYEKYSLHAWLREILS